MTVDIPLLILVSFITTIIIGYIVGRLDFDHGDLVKNFIDIIRYSPYQLIVILIIVTIAVMISILILTSYINATQGLN